MASKAELLKRIEALEAEVALLRARPIVSPIVTGPHYPHPYSPQIWCGSSSISNPRPGELGTITFNSAAAV